MFPCFWEELAMMLLIAWIPSAGAGPSPQLKQRSRYAHARGWGASWSDPSWRPAQEPQQTANPAVASFRTQVRENRLGLSSKWNIGHPKITFLNPWPAGCLVSHLCTHLPSHLCDCLLFFITLPPLDLWEMNFEALKPHKSLMIHGFANYVIF